MNEVYLSSDVQIFQACQLVRGVSPADRMVMSIKPIAGKSSRQRALQWLWYTEIANSGYGSYDTKEDVHRAAKWCWAVPLLLRDFPDSEFSAIWPELVKLYHGDAEKMKYIVDEFVSTETKGFPMSEYLTDLERYYRANGVFLTMPDDGLLDYAEKAA